MIKRSSQKLANRGEKEKLQMDKKKNIIKHPTIGNKYPEAVC